MKTGRESRTSQFRAQHAHPPSSFGRHAFSASADSIRFILNGLEHANEILGEEAFKLDDWRVIGEYVYDAEGGRHQAFYAPKRDVVVMGETIRPHERIQVEQSLKFSLEECEGLWSEAGLKEIESWMNVDGDYG